MRERLDYKEHLVGYTRQEVDNLEKLSGRFQEVEPEMVVKRLDAEGVVLEDVWIELCAKSFIDIHFGKIVRKNYDI